MSYLSSRSFAAALAVVCCACGTDQKSPNTADNADHANSSEWPATGPTQPTSAGLPTPPPAAARAAETEPASEPAPQAAEQGRAGNVVAATKPTPAPAPSAQLSEAQIAMVAELANSSEVEQGKLAQGKAKNASVKKFAAMMVKHHTEAKDEQSKLFKQLKLTPTQSQTATTLKQNAEKTTDSLRSSTAAGFDQQYIDSQVEAHQQVLDTLNQELIPAASEQQLIAGLNKMKATVEAHLREAKSIQAELQAKPQ